MSNIVTKGIDVVSLHSLLSNFGKQVLENASIHRTGIWLENSKAFSILWQFLDQNDGLRNKSISLSRTGTSQHFFINDFEILQTDGIWNPCQQARGQDWNPKLTRQIRKFVWKNKVQFNKVKCKILALRRNNQLCDMEEWMSGSSQQKRIGATAGTQGTFVRNSHCYRKGNCPEEMGIHQVICK